MHDAGVKSGTGVVNDLIMRKLRQWLQQLHTLCVANEQASVALGKLAKRLKKEQLQQLQVNHWK